MKSALPLFALLLSAGQVYAALPDNIQAGAIVQVTLAQLHPTQATVGYRQLDYKLHRYRADPKKLFDDYCQSMGQKAVERFDQHSTITLPTSFQCKAPVGTKPGAMKTAVIAPDNTLYLTDGHHTFTTFAELGGFNTPVQVRITNDFRGVNSQSAFWQKMEAAHLVWLDTPNGKIAPEALPHQLGRQDMQNDEYRSLVYFARNIGFGKVANPPPFLEFYWGKWLETRLPLKSVDVHDRTGYAAAIKRVAEAMTTVPKDSVIAQSDSGPLTAQKLGALDSVNQKELHKVVSPHGKLSWAFAQ